MDETNLKYLGYIFFSQTSPQVLEPILTHDDSKDAKSHKDVLYGVIKIKTDIQPIFRYPNR